MSQRVYGERRQRLYAPSHGDSVAAWIVRHLDDEQVRQISATTLRGRISDLGQFNDWCLEHGIERPGEVTRPMLERYQRQLFHARKRDGHPLSARSQAQRLIAVQVLFRWLARRNHILYNPAADLELPRLPLRTLRDPLSLEEVQSILAQPDLKDPFGLRDRAILELFYATGVRRIELCGLTLHDIDFNRGTLFVRQGKWKKDRFVPVGERALAWLQKYLDEVRAHLAVDPSELGLFLNCDGRALSVMAMSPRIRSYFDAAGIVKAGACHLFRHSMATHMLERGADIRYIQEILGHGSLETTQQYTHISIGRLKAVHAATHPLAQLKRREEAGALDDGADGDGAA